MIRLTAPDIYEHDAVGNFCIDLAGCLRSTGQDVRLYAKSFSEENPLGIRKMEQLATDIADDDIIVTSYSIFDPWLERIVALSNKKLCYFHSVTPPELLQKYEPVTAELCRRSQEQFHLLGRFDTLIANSRYSASHLASYIGNRKIPAMPPIFPTRPLLAEGPGPAEARKSADILMVGRIAPHKNLELGLAIFAHLRKALPEAALMIVGEGFNRAYNDLLAETAQRLGIADAVRYTGKISDRELRALYRNSGAFLCTSLHEGFCIPVLEAMKFGLPVFVRAGNAAAEVAGDAGVLFDGDDTAAIAGRITKTLGDPALPQRTARGRQIARELLQRNSSAFWAGEIAALTGATGGKQRCSSI